MLTSFDKICKRCSFKCGIVKYSARPKNKVWAFRRAPIPWTCAVFFHTARKWTLFVFYHMTDQNLQWCREVYSRPTCPTTIRWWIADAQSIAFTCYTACRLYNMYTCSTTGCGIGWYRHTSHSENTASESENTVIWYHYIKLEKKLPCSCMKDLWGQKSGLGTLTTVTFCRPLVITKVFSL